MNRTLLLCMLLAVVAVQAGAQEMETMSALTVAEAKLGKGVQDREIVDDTTTFALNDRVYLWLRVTGGPADSITVTWKTGDQSHSSKLNIGGSPWRTWSYKTAYTAGDWTVTVSDAAGNVLKEMAFTVNEQ